MAGFRDLFRGCIVLLMQGCYRNIQKRDIAAGLGEGWETIIDLATMESQVFIGIEVHNAGLLLRLG